MTGETDLPAEHVANLPRLPRGVGSSARETDFAETLVLPDGTRVDVDSEPVSVQRENPSGGWLHEALVREGRLIGLDQVENVIVKTRFVPRTPRGGVHHRNETDVLTDLAEANPSRSGRALSCTVPVVHASWAEVDDDGPTGRQHIVMTKLPGSTLKELGDDHLATPKGVKCDADLAPGDIARIFERVSVTLGQLHAAGWHLNDLNGGSILVVPEDPDFVGLVDFGHATPATFRGEVAGRGKHYPKSIDGIPSAVRDTKILAATLDDLTKYFSVNSSRVTEWQALSSVARRYQHDDAYAAHSDPAGAFAMALRSEPVLRTAERRRPRSLVLAALVVVLVLLGAYGLFANSDDSEVGTFLSTENGAAGDGQGQTSVRDSDSTGAEPDQASDRQAGTTQTQPATDTTTGPQIPVGPPQTTSAPSTSASPGLPPGGDAPTPDGPSTTTNSASVGAPSVTAPTTTGAPPPTPTTARPATMLTFDRIGGGSNVIQVYPGVDDTADHRRSNGTFLDGDNVQAICRTTGRWVSSQVALGETPRSMNDWILIVGTRHETQYATAVYTRDPATLLAGLRPC